MSDTEIVKAKAAEIVALEHELNDRVSRWIETAAPGLAVKAIGAAIQSVRTDPKLLSCERLSLYSAIIECAQYGLIPDGVRQLAHLIPYGKKCGLVVGYRGYIELMLRHRDVLAVLPPEVVYAADDFRQTLGSRPELQHTPYSGPIDERGEIVGAYAVAHLRSEDRPFKYMPIDEIETIRDRALARYSENVRAQHPWRRNRKPMILKTPLRHLAKYLPACAELQTAVSREEMYEAGKDYKVDVSPIVATQNGSAENAGSNETSV